MSEESSSYVHRVATSTWDALLPPRRSRQGRERKAFTGSGRQKIAGARDAAAGEHETDEFQVMAQVAKDSASLPRHVLHDAQLELRMMGLALAPGASVVASEQRHSNAPPVPFSTGHESFGEELPPALRAAILGMLDPESCRRSEEEAVSQRARELMHASAAKLAQSAWAANAMGEVLCHANGRGAAVVACAAGLRLMALEPRGAELVVQSSAALQGLVVVLQSGEEKATQKAAATVANVAWHSEALRLSLSGVTGLLEVLTRQLGRSEGGLMRARESALAALSNLSLSEAWTRAVVQNAPALIAIVATLTAPGSDKGRVRAAGVLRNIAACPTSRALLRSFPGALAALRSARAGGGEAAARATAALQLLEEGSDLDEGAEATAGTSGVLEGRGGARSIDGEDVMDEQTAVAALHAWLGRHGWEKVEARLFDAGNTDYSGYEAVEPHLEVLDEARGLYLFRSTEVLLVGIDRYNPSMLLEASSKKVLWDLESATVFTYPWARRFLTFKSDGRSSLILLKRTGALVARNDDPPSDAMFPPASALPNTTSMPLGPTLSTFRRPVSLRCASGVELTHGGPPRGETPRESSPEPQGEGGCASSPWGADGCSGVQVQSDQELPGLGPQPSSASGDARGADPDAETWRRMMTEGTLRGAARGTFRFETRVLSLPAYRADGLAVVRDVESGAVVYQGPGMHHVLPAVFPACHASEVGGMLLRWAAQHGWHELERRLLEAGQVDYSAYAAMDREMEEDRASPAPAEGVLALVWRGRRVHLTGGSRKAPRTLTDAATGEELWNKERFTTYAFPWARQRLSLHVLADSPAGGAGQRTLAVCEVATGETLVQLEHACYRNHPAAHAEPEAADLATAVARLRDFTDAHGWGDLEKALFDAAHTDYSRYAEMEPQLQLRPTEVEGGAGGEWYLQGRRVRLVGTRRNPSLLTDASTGEVLWALDQHQSLLYPWARAHLRVQHLPGELRVCSAETGGKIAAIIPDPLPVHFPAGPAAVEAALCCDAVQMHAVPLAQKRAVGDMLRHGARLLHVTRATAAAPGGHQLAMRPGDIIALQTVGTGGWAYGSVVVTSSGARQAGVGAGLVAGWFPLAFALPVEELVVWRGRLLRRQGSTEGHVTITDVASGEVRPALSARHAARRHLVHVSSVAPLALSQAAGAIAVHLPRSFATTQGCVGAGGHG